jgi:DNA-binding NarL/FixJ family response regulator
VDFLINGTGGVLHERLSTRELQIMAMIGAGWTPKRLAEELFISVKTVNSHRANIMQKMGFSSTADLIKYVMEHKLLP